MDEYQKKANSLFEDGEYEEAISTMALSASISAEDYKKFVAQCNSFMTEQYKVLIEQAIQNDDYNELVALHEAYKKRFGENEAIEGLVSDGLKRVKVPSLYGCPFCGEMISDEAKTCPYCGENVEEFFSALYKEKKAKATKDAKDTSSKKEILVGVKKTPILYSLIIPLATLLILSIGLLVFHVNYVFTDYWVEEELIILPIIGVAIIGLVIYYSILYKVKSGDIFKKLKNPNVIGISCFALLVIIAVSYVFVTADSGNNPAKQKQETQMEDNSMTSDDEERDTVAVEAADPDETVEEEISNDLSSKEASVKKWVEKVYANVFSNRKGLRKGTFKCDYFSEELNMWIESIEEYDREHHQGEYGFFTEDIWTKSQDPSDNISASVKSVRFETDYMDNEYAEVVVCISDYGNDKTVYLRLYPDGDSWIIGDYDGMLNNMKSYLAQQS